MLVAALAALPATAVVWAADKPATLESLENREITVEQSTPREQDPKAVLENYRHLLELTTEPDRRIRVMRRLADAELAVAVDAADPKPYARRAIDLYRQVLDQSAVSVQRAQLLYNVARASDLAGDTGAGITALSRLIEKHPDSRLVPEARFRRAEIRFVLRSYGKAAPDYAWLVARGEATPFFLQARYKLGWSRYKLGNYRDSLEQFTSVLQMLLGPGNIGTDGALVLSGLSDADQELVTDSLRGITLNFAQLSESLTPADYVRSADLQRYEYLFYDRLYAHYLDKERFTDASNTALAFAKNNPEHPRAQAFELRAIKALEAGGFNSLALERKAAFVQRYGIQGQSWQGRDPLTVPKVRQRLRDYLDEITKTYHAQAQDSTKAADYERAAEWYATYLKVFPDSPRAAELAFLRGEVLYQAERYTEAARAYEKVAYEMGDNPRAAEAGYAAVLARRKAAGDHAATNPQVEKATLRFARQYPKQGQATGVLARLAEDRYGAGELAAADKIAQRVIEHQPAASDAQLANAWRIRAAAAEKAEDFAAAETALRWLLGHAPGDKPAALRERLAAAIYKQGETLVDAGEDAKARAQFLRLREAAPAHGEPASTIRATALFDAAAASVRAGDKTEAIRLLEEFRSEYPRHERAPEATRKLAALYQETGDKAAAAQTFSMIRKQTDVDTATRREAALQTAQLRAESGQTSAAIDAYKVYLREYDPPFGDAMEARQRLIELYGKLGESAKADYWRKQIITTDAQAGTAATERGHTLAAQAALKLADDARTAFEQARLSVPLKRSLKAKKRLLEEALDAYGKAADYEIAEVTTAATFRIGQLYYDFSRALLSSPRPGDLSEDELAQYETLLEEQAFPFEEQAIDIHQANVARIKDGTYNKWVQQSLDQLGKLLPVRYAKREKLSDTLATQP